VYFSPCPPPPLSFSPRMSSPCSFFPKSALFLKKSFPPRGVHPVLITSPKLLFTSLRFKTFLPISYLTEPLFFDRVFWSFLKATFLFELLPPRLCLIFPERFLPPGFLAFYLYPLFTQAFLLVTPPYLPLFYYFRALFSFGYFLASSFPPQPVDYIKAFFIFYPLLFFFSSPDFPLHKSSLPLLSFSILG